jgi:hypothetical protein
MLNDRPVNNGEHFLRHGFGCREETRAETGNGKDGFADGFGHLGIFYQDHQRLSSGRIIAFQTYGGNRQARLGGI